MLEQFTTWSGVLFIVILAFVLRLVFVAPFLVYRKQKKEIAVLLGRIENLENSEVYWQSRGDKFHEEMLDLKRNHSRLNRNLDSAKERIRDFERERGNRSIPLGKAVEYIQADSEYGKSKTDDEILKYILKLAKGKAIGILGRHKWKGYKQAQPRDTDVLVGFLSNCRYEPRHEIAGAPALISGELTDNPNDLEIYFDPTVAIKDIERHFKMRVEDYVAW